LYEIVAHLVSYMDPRTHACQVLFLQLDHKILIDLSPIANPPI